MCNELRALTEREIGAMRSINEKFVAHFKKVAQAESDWLDENLRLLYGKNTWKLLCLVNSNRFIGFVFGKIIRYVIRRIMKITISVSVPTAPDTFVVKTVMIKKNGFVIYSKDFKYI